MLPNLRLYKTSFTFILFLIVSTDLKAQRIPTDSRHNQHPVCNYQKNEHSKWNKNIHVPLRTNGTNNLSRTTTNCEFQFDSFHELSKLGTNDLIAALKAMTPVCRTGWLFNYDDTNSPVVYTDEILQAVILEIKESAPDYDGSDATGIYGLLYFVHTAFYHEFFEDISFSVETTHLLAETTAPLSTNPHLFDFSRSALGTLRELITIMDLPGIRHLESTIDLIKKVMRNLSVDKNWKALPEDLDYSYAGAYNAIYFLMFRGIVNSDDLYQTAIATDDEFFELLYLVAADEELMGNETFSLLVRNAVLELTRMAELDTFNESVIPKLEQLITSGNFKRLEVEWIDITVAILKYGDCSVVNLCDESDEKIKQDLQNLLFPNTFSFDDGAMIVETPLSLDEVQPLYFAAKQVQAQFYRLLQSDEPLPEDENESLTMVIYGSSQAYDDYQYYLNGLPTDNGGIYIEEDGTFYTYDRKINESTFSLEELFRHEYVHYLQARFVINGSFGETPFYENNRLTWFNEGMAEFIAGSTDNQGIKVRTSLLDQIQGDEGTWMPVDEIIGASYNDGFTFYRYGGLLWSYWYEQDKEVYKQLFDLVIADDIQGYDDLLESYQSNEQLQDAYVNYIATKINTKDSWVPVTNGVEDQSLVADEPEDLEFVSTQGITISETSINVSQTNKRFAVEGIITSDSDFGSVTEASTFFDNILDEFLFINSQQKGANNMEYAVGYYKNIAINSDGAQASFLVTGPLRVGEMIKPAANFSVKQNVVEKQGTIQFFNKSINAPTEYKWLFEGGEPSESNERHPAVTYNEPGLYPVRLLATNEAGNDELLRSDYVLVVDESVTGYCSTSNSADENYISEVRLGSINHQSAWENYSDNSWFTPLLYGISDSLYINTRYFEQGYDNTLGVWIDWNQDKDFDDPDETIFNVGSTEGPLKIHVQVPGHASPGLTKMRIRINAWSDPSEPCGDDERGEVEDYQIWVTDGVINKISTSADDVIFYPNPTKGNITIQMNSSQREKYIALYSASGSLVQRDQIISMEESFNLDYSQLDKGIYFMKIRNGNDHYTKKIVLH